MAEELYRVYRNCVSGDTIIRCNALRWQTLYYVIVLQLEIHIPSDLAHKRKLRKLTKKQFWVLLIKIYVSKIRQRCRNSTERIKFFKITFLRKFVLVMRNSYLSIHPTYNYLRVKCANLINRKMLRGIMIIQNCEKEVSKRENSIP